MTRAFGKLVKWFYFVIAIALILLAVLVQSGRSFSHLLGDYDQNIASYLSSKLNAQVTIGSIEADWGGLKPGVVIQNFSIKSHSNQPIVAFKQARLRFDIVESLLNFRLVWSNLSLSQVDMTFAQTADGFWQIPGLPKRADADQPEVHLDALVDMLLLSTKIEFQSSHLSFRFVSGKEVVLDSPYLLFENSGDFHRLSLQVDVDEQSRSVYLVMEGEGDPRDTDDFRSRGYLQLNRFPTSEPIAAANAFLLSGADASSIQSEGMVDANIWFETRAGGKGYDLTGRLGLQRLSLPLGERRISLDNFSTELSGYWLPGGQWQLGLQQVKAGIGEQKIADVNLAVAAAGFNKPLKISLDNLDLARVHDMVGSVGALGEGRLQEVLKALDPRGQLHNLQLILPVHQPKEWQLRANLEQVATNAWQGVPALAGVDGYVQAGQKGGFVDIDSRQSFSMHYSPTYKAPMEYDRAKGQVAWHLQPEKNQIYVNSGQLEFQKGDELARGYMWLSLPWQRNTGDIDLYLQIGAKQLNASLYQKYTPAVVPETLLDWLEQSVGAENPGIATEAGFVYRGTLNTKNTMARTYQLYLDIEDAELNYHPGWPALTQLDGLLLVGDMNIAASVTDAGIYTSRVKHAEVRVNPRAKGKGSLLKVDSEITGAASDGIRVLREGMLRQYLGSSMDSWSMQGEMQARLDLDIPIGTGEEKPAGAHQQVSVDLQVPQFELQNLNLVAHELTGHINYNSDTGISSDTLHARFFDQPVEVTLGTRKLDDSSQTLIDISGEVDVQQLAYWSKRPELMFLKGNLPYKTLVELNHRPRAEKSLVELSPEEVIDPQLSATEFAQSAFAAVTINSDLTDVAVDLPAPYGKPAAEQRPLEVKVLLHENQAQIDVQYNADIQALFRTDRANENRLLNANIALGSEATFSTQPQFLVSGYLPGIDLDAWKEVQARYKTYTERLAPVVAQGVNAQQSAVPALLANPEVEGQIAGLPFRAELQLGQYELGSLKLENLNVAAVPVRIGWQLDLKNTIVEGRLLIPDSRFKPLQVDLARLSLTKEILGLAETPDTASVALGTGETAESAAPTQVSEPVAPKEVIDPRKLPLANITVASLMLDGNNYGNWSLQLRPNNLGVVINNIRGSIRGVTIAGVDGSAEGAKLIWQDGPEGVQSRFIGNLETGDMAAVLRAWDKPDTIESHAARYRTDLYWAGSPQDFGLVNLNGEMSIWLEKGRFKRDASAGDGILRLMSVLNFDSLARRMRLDFSDLYKSGLAYDEINGKVRFNQGILVFEEPLLVRTPSSGLQMAGTINLRKETINGRLVATLPVAGNLTFFAALATGLPAAAGVYLVSKLFKKQVDQATSISYTIKGGWDDPQMSFDRLFESEKSLRDSVSEEESSQTETPVPQEASAAEVEN
ncbi:MAG: AsmA-like C-terminal region-containing protein [Cellvibrio sp.]|uniref:YhdP family phospholipid transporter n=1 Tax=Cellvibrio sp. TaxID=1965322 RepID=UPI0031AE3027